MITGVKAAAWNQRKVFQNQDLPRSLPRPPALIALGVSGLRLVTRHVLPNALGPVIVAATLLVPRVILLESFLSFLGLGVQEPETSWGVLVAEGARAIESAPWMLAGPAGFLVATLVALNRLGDALADAADPRSGL